MPPRAIPVQAGSLPTTSLTQPSAVDVPNQSAAKAALSQGSAATGGNVAPVRKFSEMGVLERGAVIRELRKKDLAEIFQYFLDAERVEQDSMKQMAVQSVLSDELKERKFNPEFLKKLQEFIESDVPSKFERGMVLGALGDAATKETGELLLHEATTLKHADVRGDAIASVQVLGDRAENEDLSPALNRAWTTTNDPLFLRSVGISMARIGSSASVDLLLSAALAPDGRDDVRRDVAWPALRKVHTGNAVSPLAAVLEKSPSGSRENTLAFETLSQIVGKEAPQAVMKWLRTTDSSAAPMAAAWAVHARHDLQLELAQAALDPKVPFRSEENRKALREGLDAYRAAHKQFEK